MYPLTSRPEASNTCPSVGALAAWASATVGAANAAETADAMRSFFIVSVLSWMGKILPLLFISTSNLPGCSNLPGRIGLSPETPSPYLPDPDQRTWFRSCRTPQECEKLPGLQPWKRRKDRPKKDFFQLLYYGGPLGAGRGAVMMDAISTLPVGVLPP